MPNIKQSRRIGQIEFITPLEANKYCFIDMKIVKRDDIGCTAKIVYGMLNNISNYEVCKISIEILAEKIGSSKTTTRNALKELVKRNLIQTPEDLSEIDSSILHEYTFVVSNNEVKNKNKESLKCLN